MVNKVDAGLFEFNNRKSIEQNLNLRRSSLRKIKNWNSLVDHTENGKLEAETTRQINDDRNVYGFGIVKQLVSSFSSQLMNNEKNKAACLKEKDKEFQFRKSLSFNSKHTLSNKQVTIFNRNADNSLTETKHGNFKIKALTKNESNSNKELDNNQNYEGKFNFKII